MSLSKLEGAACTACEAMARSVAKRKTTDADACCMATALGGTVPPDDARSPQEPLAISIAAEGPLAWRVTQVPAQRSDETYVGGRTTALYSHRIG